MKRTEVRQEHKQKKAYSDALHSLAISTSSLCISGGRESESNAVNSMHNPKTWPLAIQAQAHVRCRAVEYGQERERERKGKKSECWSRGVTELN